MNKILMYPMVYALVHLLLGIPMFEWNMQTANHP